MKKYLFLQIKRTLKFLPFVLAVTLVLLIGLSAALTGLVGMFTNREDKQPVNIAITGDTDNEYMKWGMSALQSLDETRFSIKLLNITEEEAVSALEKGEIAAYVVFPENFIEKAINGNVEPVKYVTTNGINDIVTLFQNELTSIITKIMVYSEKGVYGVSDAIYYNDIDKDRWEYATNLSVEYVDLIIHRADVFKVKELGFSSGLDIAEYFLCGITLLLISLMGLPYAIIYVRRDHSLNKLLVSRGHSSFSQLLCEYVSHLIAMLLLSFSVLGVIGIASGVLTESVSGIIDSDFLWNFANLLIPVLIMLSAFNILIFELCDNMVSAVLSHFFAVLGLCYISGCLYPVYTFPVAIQRLSSFLPTGIAREHLSSCFTGDGGLLTFLWLIVYAILFFCVALLVRTRKTTFRSRG